MDRKHKESLDRWITQTPEERYKLKEEDEDREEED